MKTILLKLAGPLQSWGTSSKFRFRKTDPYPSKSAVIGILAASFGYQRDDPQISKFNKLSFAVRVDQPGRMLRDYHIAQKLNSKRKVVDTYVTHRWYLQDAVFVVAIGSDNLTWIEEIEHALKHPCYQPFLGRRSNPLTADFFIKTVNNDVITSLEELEWKASDWHKRKNAGEIVLPIYADAFLIADSPVWMVRDRVISFSQKERLYGYRAVARKEIVLIPSSDGDNHDAFNAF